MTTLVFGNEAAPDVLIQPVDSHDLGFIEDEVKEIRRLAGEDFCLLAVRTDDWNRDLSPWQAPAVFGTEGFGGRGMRGERPEGFEGMGGQRPEGTEGQGRPEGMTPPEEAEKNSAAAQ